MRLEDKELIIFDLDGTLIDSVPDLALGVNSMLQELGREAFTLSEIHSWVGNGAQTLVKRALLGKVEIDESIDEELFKNALAIFLDSYKKNVCVNTVAYPNVLQTLRILKENSYTMAIVTNKPYQFIEPILKTLQMDNFFELCIGGDSLDEKKPSPKPLLYICEQLGVKPQNTLMVGDSKNDILSAKAANIESIGVT